MRPEDVTVNAADIARLADVGRAAVSNWRKRFEDFPQPVGGTASSPAFSLAEVEAWLRRHGRYVEVAPVERLWQRLRASTDDIRLGDAVAYAGTLLLSLRDDPGGWRERGDGSLLERLPEAPPEGVVMDASLVRAIVEVGEAEGPAATFRGICDRYVELHSRRLLATPRPVAELMARLGGTAGATVLDPACGIGTLLLASGAARALGQELNESAARLAGICLRFADAAGTVMAGDSLRADAFPGELADVVVCNPPFNERGWGYEELTSDPRWEYGLPPRGESELAWVQHCLSHVKPGGLVVIMMPGTAAARRPGRRIRGNLLRAGALRAVITLSPGAAPASSGAPDLWVLRRPAPGDNPPSDVLMVNAGGDLDLAEKAWQAFAEGAELPAGSASVRIIDLLDEEVDLSTGHRVVSPEQPDPAGYAAVRERTEALLRDLGAGLPRLVAGGRKELPMTTVGELVRAGVVVIMQGPLKMPNEGDLPMLTAEDLLLGRPASGRTSDVTGQVRIEAGDVVAPLIAGSGPVPRVMTEPGAVLGAQLLLLRADPERLDPHFLAGCLRAAGGTSTRLGSSMRFDPRRAQLPRLAVEEQRRYGEAFRKLLEFEDAMRAAREMSETLVAAGFDGLFDGTLRLD
ncbi:SAM-dependent methyltransferase [Microbispora rosea subsp. aerata]|nr:N-6 DNA methylase [Microbispora rosea]GGO16748.1 SAM-dependent methyltransferase [Microbispora rosea subsp. aerata]GIH56003.1 SAM-dependent methyltransferase [Microbispora rosea subsp. aerata]GLJ86899.1 SAM-dependent methyltransferase [Microbispora rosea subsp. aerata]